MRRQCDQPQETEIVVMWPAATTSQTQNSSHPSCEPHRPCSANEDTQSPGHRGAKESTRQLVKGYRRRRNDAHGGISDSQSHGDPHGEASLYLLVVQTPFAKLHQVS